MSIGTSCCLDADLPLGFASSVVNTSLTFIGHNNGMKRSLIIGVILILSVSACAPVTIATDSPLPPTHTPMASLSPTASPTLEPTSRLTPTPPPTFSFVVTTDMSHVSAPEYIDYPNFFAGLLRYVKDVGAGDFMVSIGDIIPAAGTDWTIDQVLGEDYLWYPMPGNHDFGKAELSFLQSYDYDPNGAAEPNIVSQGPASCPQTTYSFDYKNAHFVALNVYCNEDSPWGIDGSITDTLYQWLAADLAATDKENIFVFGHEPAFPQPDAQTGITRHWQESLDQYPAARDRFWELLKEHQVVAYFNGHTHGYSAVKIEGVWQIDAGHAAGTRAGPSPGTFLVVHVVGGQVAVETYRGEAAPGFSYVLTEEIQLKPSE